MEPTLKKIAPIVRLPTSLNHPPEMLPDGAGLMCPVTGRVFPFKHGVLDVLGDDFQKTMAQSFLDTSLTSWAYDRFRAVAVRLAHFPDFEREVAQIQRSLDVQPGDTILDLACGHGNFTCRWGQWAGPEGVVIGLDISPSMLARAVSHVGQAGLGNIVFIRGDVQNLPFADGVFTKVNCSGGFHQFPDLEKALSEIARVSKEGAVLTGSTFAEDVHDPRAGLKRWARRILDLHFVPLDRLGDQLEVLGYQDYAWSIPGGWFGSFSARKKR